LHQKRIIWYYSYQNNDYKLITFLDGNLKVQEKTDYLQRTATHPEEYTKEGFYKKLHRFGMLTMVYKVEKQEKQEKAGKRKK
jgi:hypothetical protein